MVRRREAEDGGCIIIIIFAVVIIIIIVIIIPPFILSFFLFFYVHSSHTLSLSLPLSPVSFLLSLLFPLRLLCLYPFSTALPFLSSSFPIDSSSSSMMDVSFPFIPRTTIPILTFTSMSIRLLLC
uniref:KIAA1657-like protein n=1 Tax=Penaeus monodon TaxID=6687 RepID=Q8MWB9_PENMO|nr:KIAA1657-like protein [Penaeus monodon]